jgi:N2-acetyl-L-2,4-diaminobutanoate deacetylase
MMTPDHRPTRISTDVDYSLDGRQFGYLSVPYSRDDSAWGSVQLPVVVIRNGEGPTVLFTGGNHGDEYEGPIALLKLARELDHGRLAGRVILLPTLNLPAVRVGRRTSPLDGGNMNRSFPGSARGGVTAMIAHYVYTELLPLADVVVDLHSGGRTLDFVPSAIMHELADRSRMDRTLEALHAFGAPVGLVLLELDREGLLDTAVEELGKIFLSTELGGGGSARASTVAIAERGARNVLRHFGLLDERVEERVAAGEPPMRLLHTPATDSYVIAQDHGLFEMALELGSPVSEGDVVGRIHYYEDPARPPLEQVARRSGVVLARHFPGLIHKGDCLAVIGEPYGSG